MLSSPVHKAAYSHRYKVAWKEDDLFDNDTESDASDWENLTEDEKERRRKTASVIDDLPKEFNTFVEGAVVKENEASPAGRTGTTIKGVYRDATKLSLSKYGKFVVLFRWEYNDDGGITEVAGIYPLTWISECYKYLKVPFRDWYLRSNSPETSEFMKHLDVSKLDAAVEYDISRYFKRKAYYDATAASQYCTRVMSAAVYTEMSCDSDRGDDVLKKMLHNKNFNERQLKAIAKRKQELLKPYTSGQVAKTKHAPKKRGRSVGSKDKKPRKKRAVNKGADDVVGKQKPVPGTRGRPVQKPISVKQKPIRVESDGDSTPSEDEENDDDAYTQGQRSRSSSPVRSPSPPDTVATITKEEIIPLTADELNEADPNGFPNYGDEVYNDGSFGPSQHSVLMEPVEVDAQVLTEEMIDGNKEYVLLAMAHDTNHQGPGNMSGPRSAALSNGSSQEGFDITTNTPSGGSKGSSRNNSGNGDARRALLPTSLNAPPTTSYAPPARASSSPSGQGISDVVMGGDPTFGDLSGIVGSPQPPRSVSEVNTSGSNSVQILVDQSYFLRLLTQNEEALTQNKEMLGLMKSMKQTMDEQMTATIKINAYFNAKAAASRLKNLTYVDAQRNHSVNLPCKTIQELQAFDNKLKREQCMQDFMAFLIRKADDEKKPEQKIRVTFVRIFAPKLCTDLVWSNATCKSEASMNQFLNVMKLLQNLFGDLKETKKVDYESILQIFRQNTKTHNKKTRVGMHHMYKGVYLKLYTEHIDDAHMKLAG